MRGVSVVALCLGVAAVALPAAATSVSSVGVVANPDPASAPAHIGGRVFDDGGEPVGGARVELVGRGGIVLAQTRSERDGSFRFRPVRPGTYIVRAAARDVGQGRVQVEAESGRNFVRVRLTR